MRYMCAAYVNALYPRYFSALAKGECLPVKERLEMNVATQKTDTGLTPELLKTLHKQVFSQQQGHKCLEFSSKRWWEKDFKRLC